VTCGNTRGDMTGLPKRNAHVAKLEAGQEAEHWLDRVSTEFAHDVGNTQLPPSFELARDPRVALRLCADFVTRSAEFHRAKGTCPGRYMCL